MRVDAIQTLSGDRGITLFQSDFLMRYAGQELLKKLDVQIDFIFTDQDPTSQDAHPDDDPEASGICVRFP